MNWQEVSTLLFPKSDKKIPLVNPRRISYLNYLPFSDIYADRAKAITAGVEWAARYDIIDGLALMGHALTAISRYNPEQIRHLIVDLYQAHEYVSGSIEKSLTTRSPDFAFFDIKTNQPDATLPNTSIISGISERKTNTPLAIVEYIPGKRSNGKTEKIKNQKFALNTI